MAFTYTVKRDAMGSGVAYGTYTNTSGSTGGDVKTGLQSVEVFVLSPKGTAVVANQSAVNETLPLASGDVTIVTNANEVGSWIAFGN